MRQIAALDLMRIPRRIVRISISLSAVKAVNQLSGKVSQMEEKPARPEPVQVAVDTASVREVVRKGITEIMLLAAAKPRPLVRKF